MPLLSDPDLRPANVMKFILRFLSVTGLLFLATLAASAAPANDNFFSAITLTGPIVTTTGDNVGATKSFGQEPIFIAGDFGGASVWWNWTATASGPTTIDTEGSDFDTLLGVFTGTAPNALTLVGGNNNYNENTWSRVDFNAIAGTTYRIDVDGFRIGGGAGGRASQGNITLHIKGVGGIAVSPTNGTVFTIGDPVQIDVTTDANFPNPPASRVSFFVRGSLLTTVSNAPFRAVANNLPAGSNSFYVIAYDSLGNAIQSGVVNILVQNIGVTLLAPAEDAYFLSGAAISATAWSYLPGGTMTNIEFFVDGVKFAEDSTPPFSGTWSNATGGSHRLTTTGRSDTGARYNSQPVNIGVASLLVHSNAVWKYLDNGSDQGTAWVAPGFDDSTWASGPAELGYGDADERTLVNSGPANAFYATTYFRRSFVASNTASFVNLLVLLAYDDAGIVYLNGREVYRTTGLPTNVAYNTYSSGQAIEETVDIATLNSSNLVEGVNVLAVEIHQQSPTSSDISFFLQLSGVPRIIHNLSPTVSITNLASGAFFLVPPTITVAATAADGDGSVAKVEFFADGLKFAESTAPPYTVMWSNPPVAAHVLTAVATDDQGATTTSDEIPIVVYDADGRPVTAVTSPVNSIAMDGPTNLLITATANAITGVTNVQFLANGIPFGNDTTAPYAALWTAPFGTNALTAIAFDATGVRGTSMVITVLITIPPTNLIAPTLATRTPIAGATVTNLTSISVTFSEFVQNIDASDLLINGIPATGVNGANSRTNYTFTFAQPPYGAVNITWAADHGITDYGFPTVLPFDRTGPGATWSYTLIDKTPPTLVARTPAPGSTVTNLAQISVTFSEPVTGIVASNLLVNGNPANGLSGSGANYTFNVAQPAAGTLNITWATNHSIIDTAAPPNSFVGTGTNAAWSFTLDTRVVLVQSNSNWRLFKGLAEASAPASAWRQPGFDDSSWSNSPAPFFFGDPYTNASIPGTLLSDMLSNYSTIFLRRDFNVTSRGSITSLQINHQSDDGFIAWLNGVEVLRYNVPSGELAYNALASTAASEPNQAGAAYIVATLTNSAVSRLVNGTNNLAIMGFNQSLTNSTDFGFNAQLYYFPVDASAVAPRVVSVEPVPGDLFYLTNATFSFSEGVTGVDATDLLVNGVPATGVSTTTNSVFTFSFPQPPYGPVALIWVTNHGIVDFDTPTPRAFDGTNAGASYVLLNPSSPRIATQTPLAGTTITGLTSIALSFTEPVANVDASDLLINGTPAGAVSTSDNTSYLFTFLQPPFGSVAIRWATNHGITDREAVPAPFDPTRFGGQWNYTLVNPAPSVTLNTPTNNTYVLPPGTFNLRATATDNDGTISLVEFYSSGDKLGEATNSPYTLTISNVPLGSYILRAVATDNSGLRGTSAPVAFYVVTILPINLTRGPYLQSGSPYGGIVRWRTDLVSDAIVYYGTDVANLTNIATESSITNEHIVSIGGLLPSTRYYYSIGSTAQRLVGGTNNGANYWFKSSPVPGTRQPVRFWALGDAGTAGNGSPDRQASTRDAFYNFAATNGPTDLMLMLGDNAYNSGTDSEHQAAVFNMYPTTLRNKFLWPTLGNHETGQSTTATDFPYLNIFSLPKNGEAGGVPSGTEKYYSFDYANVHFICLDSMTSGRTGTTPMAQWLQNDLNETAQEWVLVFFHHSLYTKGTHDSDSESDLVELRQNIIPILEANGVDMVIMGHSHVYERSYLLDGHYGLSSTMTDSMKIDGGDGREAGTGAYRKNSDGRGVVYNIAGCSGQALGGPLNHPAHFVSLNELGSVIIDVVSNRLDAKFLTASGEIHDNYTLLKPEQNPPAPLNLIVLATNASNILLSWTPGSTRQTGYSIERSLDGVNFAQQLLAGETATNALDSGLLANVTYYYRIRATNSYGVSDYSNVSSATSVTPAGVPRAPTALAATAGNGAEFYRSQILLRWQDRSTDESAFQIERSIDSLTFVPVATVAANINFYLDRKLQTGTDYYYRVRAFNGRGLSAPSNVSSDETHPQSQVALQGTPATFHAGAEGLPSVLYQWRYLGIPIPNQTNEAFSLINVQPTDEGSYTVLITDASGRFVSNPAYLFVVGPPWIVSQPQDRTNVASTAASFTVVANGTAPYTYRWRKNGSLIPGANSPTFTIPSPQFSDAAGYDVIVENPFGAVVSRSAQLSVLTPPQFGTITDVVANVLTPVRLSSAVTDLNTPPLNLVYSLAPGAPVGAAINTSNGVFRWTPTRAQAGTTNPITIRAVDSSRSFLSNSISFTVFVNDFIEITSTNAALLAGSSGSVPIDINSSAKLLSLQSIFQLDTTRLSNLTVEALAPAQATVALAMMDPNTASITFTPGAGLFLQNTQHLARLRFTAVTNQSSAFVPLHFVGLAETRATPGAPPTLLATDARIAIVGATPLVEAIRSSTGQRSLNVYGIPGTTNAILQTTNITDPGAWTLRGNLAMGTNVVRNSVTGTPLSPYIYYRLRLLP